VNQNRYSLIPLLIVLCLATISCTAQRDAQPTANIEGTVAAQVQATMQASGNETTGQIVITTPAGSISTQTATVDIAGTGPADTTVQLHQVKLPVIGEETRHQIATAQVDSGGTWQVRDVPLECGPNTFVAEDEGTRQESNMVDIVRSAEPPGPYVTSDPSAFAGAENFTSQDKVVATYYFYWYDSTGAIDAETCEELEALRKKHLYPLIDHEIDESPGVFTWKNVAWHKRHMQDMSAARIDIVLPVYWGVPCQVGDVYETTWSIEGLRKLVEAQELLLAEGSQPPKIGMFYDTGSLGVPTTYWDYYMHEEADGTRTGADLTTPIGMERFYLPIRDFFSLVPPKLWARIDDKPIVWLYNDAWAWDYSATTFRYIKEQFAKDFGGLEPYIVRESSWDEERVRDDAGWATDNAYVWGVSLYGYEQAADTITAIGPGYDESALKDRYCQDECKPDSRCTPCAGENTEGVGCPRMRGRDAGAWYESQWRQVLEEQESVHLVAIETWNEYHEGNDIAETRESGRKYIELTAKWAAMFKGQEVVAAPSGQIAFISNRDGDRMEIYIMNADGSNQTRLTNLGVDDTPLALSPDGKRIVSYTRDGIYVVHVDGSGLTRLTDQRPSGYHFSWSPDGTRIAIVGTLVMNADGSGEMTSLTGDSYGVHQSGWQLSWSPDGRRVLFVSDRDGSNDVYVMSSDGSGQTRFTNDMAVASAPSWSPDGNRILFVSSRDGSNDIYVMKADGSEQTRVTDISITNWVPPVWSPDGMHIAFVSERDGNLEIYSVDADGSQLRNLTNNPSGDLGPAWSPSGRYITFNSDRDENSEIYLMNADGTGPVRLTKNPSSDFLPVWVP
jgi:Tol biopolymer transport system component